MTKKNRTLQKAEVWQISQVMDGQCKKILKDLNKFNAIKLDLYSKGSYYITSPSINLSEKEKIPFRYKMAIESMRRSITALKGIGLELEIKELGWSNCPNSCENILGNIGYFYLKYAFKKPTK